MDDEDFPSLCEEIDPDILKKASQAQNTTEPTSVSPPAKENDKDEKLEEYSGTHWIFCLADVYLRPYR